jgi:hypothetical protein
VKSALTRHCAASASRLSRERARRGIVRFLRAVSEVRDTAHLARHDLPMSPSADPVLCLRSGGSKCGRVDAKMAVKVSRILYLSTSCSPTR